MIVWRFQEDCQSDSQSEPLSSDHLRLFAAASSPSLSSLRLLVEELKSEVEGDSPSSGKEQNNNSQ